MTQSTGHEDTNCTGANRGSDSLWKNRFGSDEGPLFGLAIGFDMPESIFRTELEYFYRDTGYDDTGYVTSTGGTVFAKLGGEIETAVETIDSVTSHNLFANLYIDFDNPGGITPYIGIGLGLGFTEMDYGGVFQRNIDPAAISTGDGLPMPLRSRPTWPAPPPPAALKSWTTHPVRLPADLRLDYPSPSHLVAG